MSIKMTVREAFLNGASRLEQEGVENARYDAGELLLLAAGFPEGSLPLHMTEELSEEILTKYDSLLERRALRYPLQYLLREWDFYNLSFSVKEGVLIPRPETELLVDLALEHLKKHFSEGEPATVLDLCSGSGCVGITVERNFQNCHVVALEKSADACGIIRANMEKNHTERFTLVEGDLFKGPEALGLPKADIILSNPPYLTREEMDCLPKELEYEPVLALYGGEDGMLFYRAIADLYKDHIKKNGLLAVEIGEQQGEDVSKIFSKISSDTAVLKDYSGLPRVVLSRP